MLIIATAFFVTGCKKYLDEKSDKSLVVPSSLQDVQSLLDNYDAMNATYPYVGAQGDDDFFITDSYFNTLSVTNQNNYIWSKDALNKNEWTYMYRIVMASNLALETLDRITPSTATIADWNKLKGSALFYRAYAFFQLAQYYAGPYDKTTAAHKLGIPLRLNTNVNEKSIRSSLENTWQQIVRDLKEAIQLLPVQNTQVYRPSKAAAFGALARAYLAIEDYTHAGDYADSCLQLNNTLINYNNLNASASNPFTRWNAEVIFSSVCLGASMLGVNNWKCDSVLYQSYGQNDLRRTCFFKTNTGNVYGFKGNYDGTTASSFFNGIATDEMYLIKAECLARNNKVNEAMNTLNDLLVTRWKVATFVRFTASDAYQALNIILTERRKELVLRSTRWFDLRRLNKDVRFAKTLTRKIGGQVYTLPPNDNRYTHYIPLDVIAITGMQQNER